MHAKVRFMFLDHFWANLVRKIKILKFATKANSNMQNSMVMFIFFCFRLEISLLRKFGSKIQNCLSQI